MTDKKENIDLLSENKQEYSSNSITFEKWETQILQKARKKLKRLTRKKEIYRERLRFKKEKRIEIQRMDKYL